VSLQSRKGAEVDPVNIQACRGDLQVRVEGKELALRTTRKDYQAEANDVIFSLSVRCFTVTTNGIEWFRNQEIISHS